MPLKSCLKKRVELLTVRSWILRPVKELIVPVFPPKASNSGCCCMIAAKSSKKKGLVYGVSGANVYKFSGMRSPPDVYVE